MTTPDTAERIARAALSATVEPGRADVARALLAAGPVDTWATIRRGSPHLDPNGVMARRAATVNGARLVEDATASGVAFLCPGDDDWPEQLATMTDTLESGDEPVPPPIGLWVRGRYRLPEVLRRAVAVVGSRASTAYGDRVACDLAADLALRGWTVTSGAAYGIDAAAHRGVLAMGGPTVAVLACGVDLAYPRAHAGMLERIADQGAILSEVPCGTNPTRSRFLSRNRVIAALTSGTVVVEAAMRSGALNTANWAHKLGREVLVVPGPVTSALSAGVHDLARQGGAVLVTDAAEIIDAAGAFGADAVTRYRTQDTVHDRLSRLDRYVVESMPGGGAVSAAALADVTRLAVEQVTPALDRLAAVGLVRHTGDGWRITGVSGATTQGSRPTPGVVP